MKTAGIWGVVIVAIGLGATAPAATFVWDGGGTDVNWSTAANWNPDGAPPNDGTADLQFAGSVRTGPSPDGGTWRVNSITFNSGASAFTINSTNIVAIGAGGITNNSSNGQTIDNPLQLTASQTWNMSTKNLSLNLTTTTKQLDLNGYTLTITNASNPTLRIYDPIISSSGAGSIVNTAGYLFLYSTNSSTGGIVLGGGVLYVYNVSGIGGAGANLTWQAGTLNWMSTDTRALTNNIVFPYVSGNAYALSMNSGNNAFFTGNISSTAPVGGLLTIGGTYSMNFDTTAFQLHLSGNNSGWTWTGSGFSAQPVLITGANLYLDSAHAMGTNNSGYIQLGVKTVGSSGLSSLFASNGVVVTGPINVNPSIQSGALGGDGDVILGQYGGGTATFSGPIKLNGQNNAGSAMRSVVLTAGSNGVATFSSVIQDGGTNGVHFPIIVRGAGAVRLATNNTYAGATTIRAGTLLLGTNAPSGANGALGSNAASVASLGDTTTFIADVRVATPPTPGSYAYSGSGGGYTSTLNRVTWNAGSGPTAIDGVTLNNGDRILYMTECNAYGGIYVRTTQDQWDRATDFDEVKVGEIGYGASVYVQQGTQEGGHRFYLGNQDTPFVLGTTPFVWSMEEYNPNVALLTDGPFTVGRAINVVSNNSTGTSTLGGNTGDTSTFSGAIALYRNAQLTAATNGTAIFSGQITGSGGVTKVGAGKVRLTNGANSYAGGTSIRMTAGEIAAGGKLEVTGTLDLSGPNDVLAVPSGTLDPATTYTIASYGALLGAFDVVNIGRHTVRYNGPGNTIQLVPPPSGSTFVIR